MITAISRFGACSVRGKGFLLSLALVAALGAIPEARGIAYWTGVNGGYWSNVAGTNWSSTAGSPGTPYIPVNGDTLEWRGNFGSNKVSTNDFVGLSVGGLTMNNSNPTGIQLNGTNKLTLTGAITGGGTGSNTINLPLEVNTATLSLTGGTIGSGLLTINGDITETGGSRSINIQTGAVALNGSNSFSGTEMQVGVAGNATISVNALANTTVVQPLGNMTRIRLGTGSNNGTLIYTGSANAATDRQLQIGRIDGNYTGSSIVRNNGSGTITWNGAQYTTSAQPSATRTLTLGGTNTGDNTWAVEIKNNRTDTQALIGLIKEDAGKWILSGNNTYDGPTTVSAGTLLINGNQSGATGAVSVASGATLGGTGTVGGAVSVAAGATLAPGNAGVGTLTVTGAVTLAEGAGYKWECQNGAGDLVSLTGSNGTLTLPSVATVQVSRISGDLPSPATLFTATALAGATDLSGWIVSGVAAGKVTRDVNSVVLKMGSSGTLLSVR